MPDSSFRELVAPFDTDARVDSEIDEQGWQSFPASDPPSTWWGGSGDSTP